MVVRMSQSVSLESLYKIRREFMYQKEFILKVTSLFLAILILSISLYANNSTLTKQEKAMFKAARENDVKTIRELAHAGVYLDVKNESGETPLHEAARFNSNRAILTLYEEGAYIEEQDNQGYTPRCVANRNGHSEAAGTLEELEIKFQIEMGTFPEDHCY